VLPIFQEKEDGRDVLPKTNEPAANKKGPHGRNTNFLGEVKPSGED